MQVRTFILFAVLFQSSCVTRPEPSLTFHTPEWVEGGPVTYLPSGRYVSKVTLERLRKTPRWSASSSWPPLSPRNAERIAATVFFSLNPSEGLTGAQWTRESICLVPFNDDYWYYVIRFTETAYGYGGAPPFADIVVFMDGTFITPVLSEKDKK